MSEKREEMNLNRILINNNNNMVFVLTEKREFKEQMTLMFS